MIFTQNILIYCGIYTVITGIWQLAEQVVKKEITPSKRDTVIALILALVLWTLFKV